MAPSRTADFPALGFDPSPGDTYAVGQIVTSLKNVHDAMTEIADVLHGVDDGDWRGDAAIAFRDLLDDDVRPKVDKTVTAFDGAHHAISTWSNALSGYQERARYYEQKAAEAQADADSARARLDHLPDAPPPGAPAPETPAERDRLDDAAEDRQRAVGDQQDALAEVERYRGYARRMHDDEYLPDARTAAARLGDAIDIAPSEPGWFSRAMDSLGDFFDAIGDVIADLGDIIVDALHSLAPLLQAIGDIAGLLAGVLGVLSLIPGLQFLALPALVLAGVALVTHYGARVGETGSFTEPFTEPQFWLDVASVALGAGGLAIGAKMSKLAVAARGSAATPPTFFKLVQGGVYTSQEMNYLLGSWKITQISTIMDGLGAPGGIRSTVDTVTGRTPLTQGPVVR